MGPGRREFDAHFVPGSPIFNAQIRDSHARRQSAFAQQIMVADLRPTRVIAKPPELVARGIGGPGDDLSRKAGFRRRQVEQLREPFGLRAQGVAFARSHHHTDQPGQHAHDHQYDHDFDEREALHGRVSGEW